MLRRRFALALIATAALTGLAGLVVTGRLLARPEAAAHSSPVDPAAGLAVQRAVVELFLREAGASSRRDPVVMTAPELNAFLRRHLEARRLNLRSLVVRLEDGWLEVAGRTSVRQLLRGRAPRGLETLLPGALLELDLWPGARGRLRVRGREMELVVEKAVVGRQGVSPGWLWAWLGLDPGRVLRWRMPRVVARVEVERGRLVIHTRRPNRH